MLNLVRRSKSVNQSNRGIELDPCRNRSRKSGSEPSMICAISRADRPREERTHGWRLAFLKIAGLSVSRLLADPAGLRPPLRLTPLADQQIRMCAGDDAGVWVRQELCDIVLADRPAAVVNDSKWLRSGPVTLINGRWLPPLPARPMAATQPCVGMVGGTVAFAVVTPELLAGDLSHGLDDCLERLKRTLPHVNAGGSVVQHLWDLVDANTAQLVRRL